MPLYREVATFTVDDERQRSLQVQVVDAVLDALASRP